MSELKFPFKFAVYGHDDLYLIELLDNGSFLVTNIRTKSVFNFYTETELLERIRSGVWKVVDEDYKEQDPEVVIKQSDYDSLVDEINMLRELVAEITLQSDFNSLEQQASTCRALNEKMLKHQSYKQGDGGSTRIGELSKQLDVLFAAYDSLACKPKEEQPKQQFKPISEMTLEDWQRALEEGWEFETREGDVISVIDTAVINSSYPVKCDNSLLCTIRGYFWDSGKEYEADIIKRIK